MVRKKEGLVLTVSICPTITTDNQDVYNQQIELTLTYAHRIHIDLADGIFTPNRLTEIENVWWPGGVRADLHVMYQQPFDHVAALVSLRPQLIIVHAESEGDFLAFAGECHRHGIEVGVALLPETSVESIAPALEVIDHVLIFSGHLGHFGGHADMSLLGKVQELRQLKPQLEIGWDGGVSDANARALALGGVDVLNAGGYLHGALAPKTAYLRLLAEVTDKRS
jgi:ribulose-phosphate 3-epimerase